MICIQPYPECIQSSQSTHRSALIKKQYSPRAHVPLTVLPKPFKNLKLMGHLQNS